MADFHAGRPGIIEQVLSYAHDSSGDVWDWLAAALPEGGRVLDVGCGSAPLWPRLPDRAYLGLDVAAAQLTARPQER